MTVQHTARFENRNAVVTGGAQGIGRAVAGRLLAEGARVIAWDSDAAALEVMAAELAGRGAVATVVLDITDDEAVEAAAARLEADHGTIDILVHSAGIAGPAAPVVDYPAAEWRRVVDVDLNGAFVLPHPGMLPSRSPIASPECSRSTIAASSANTL